MATSKYYELFASDNISEDIISDTLGGATFEDHYWHLACLALYYKQKKDDELEKICLSRLCDLNFIFNSLYYFDTLKVLPFKYKKYIEPFNNQMTDPKLNAEIERHNKLDRRKKSKKYWLYSLTSLLVIPLMLFLRLVCNLSSDVSIIISVVFLLFIQTLTNPFMEGSAIQKAFKKWFSFKKKRERVIPKYLNEYLKYLERFEKIMNNDYYVALIKENDENKVKELVKSIKEKNLNV